MGLWMCSCGGGGNVYWANTTVGQVRVKRTKVASATDWSTGTTDSYPTPYVCFCFDRLNELLFMDDGSTGLYSLAESDVSGTPSLIATLSTSPVVDMDCDPTNERLFLIVATASTSGQPYALELRKINYDGSGSAQLKSWTLTSPELAVSGLTSGTWMTNLRYDLTDDVLYYIQRTLRGYFGGFPDYAVEIRSIAPDGTGDTLIKSYTAAPGGSYNAFSLAIDFQNRFLFWTNEDVFSGHAGGVQRANMDGSSPSVIYTPVSPSSAQPFIYFSQTEQKLYVWDANLLSPGSGTIKRMNGDGSSVETLVTLPGPFVDTHRKFALGAPFETLGAGAIL